MHWPQAGKFAGESPYSSRSIWISTYVAVDSIDPFDKDGQLITYDTPLFNETWTRMEKIYKSGRAKAIGVSNFSVKKYVISVTKL